MCASLESPEFLFCCHNNTTHCVLIVSLSIVIVAYRSNCLIVCCLLFVVRFSCTICAIFVDLACCFTVRTCATSASNVCRRARYYAKCETRRDSPQHHQQRQHSTHTHCGSASASGSDVNSAAAAAAATSASASACCFAITAELCVRV